MTWHDITWHDMTWHEMTWHDMTWHDMTWHDMTCRLKVCTGVTSINIKLPRFCSFSHFPSRPPALWRRYSLPRRLQFVNTNIHCSVFPSCYMCYLSSDISHQFAMAVCLHYPRSYIPIEYFNSQLQWRIVAKKISHYFFLIAVTALDKSFQNSNPDKIRTLHFVLPQFNIHNLSLSYIILSAHCDEALRG